ncbi:MAG: IS66 family insertion sequence element accessory protein TnpB [Mesorhizobium sp.]|nr:MAG: IS66 family insertion sequence hypothetical protein [Mesorhizobium sp.]RWB58778.1 MAG: IS66 family insertion sequence hypothetical protein [Mesorhizobium sp.]TIU35746.1 MAG: IS66 family insertion sequence element accessory protein TnpB [Mesorhizobium sp.]TIU66109.1 MAG: IS66 family insertion sequence element accessory protein TnpB [Mesorhizobium sp.]
MIWCFRAVTSDPSWSDLVAELSGTEDRAAMPGRSRQTEAVELRREGALAPNRAMATVASIDVRVCSEVERACRRGPDPAGKIVVAFQSGARINGRVDPTTLRLILAELTK